MYWIKTVEGQDALSAAQIATFTNQKIHRVSKAKRGHAHNEHAVKLSHSCERDYQKHQYAASDVLTIVGEDYQGYLQGK